MSFVKQTFEIKTKQMFFVTQKSLNFLIKL